MVNFLIQIIYKFSKLVKLVLIRFDGEKYMFDHVFVN